jgi:nitrite reductase (NADH) small subunit
MNMGDWKLVCRVDDIPVLGSRRVSRPNGMDVAVFRNDENQVFALLDRCPHKGGPLSQGIVFGTSVACPLHNWTIGLADGCAREPDEGCTPAFRVKLDDGDVFLLQTELDTLALDLVTPVAGPKISIAVA